MSDIFEDIGRQLASLQRQIDHLQSLDRGIAYIESNTSAPPTDAQVDALFGTPASRHNGWMGIIFDTATIGTETYIVVAANGAWYRFNGTILT